MAGLVGYGRVEVVPAVEGRHEERAGERPLGMKTFEPACSVPDDELTREICRERARRLEPYSNVPATPSMVQMHVPTPWTLVAPLACITTSTVSVAVPVNVPDSEAVRSSVVKGCRLPYVCRSAPQ